MNRLLTLLACSALIIGAVAIPATADQGERDDDRKDMANEKGQERREMAKEKAMERHEEMKAKQASFSDARDACKAQFQEAKANNTTVDGYKNQGKCISEEAKAKHDPAHKARRAHHHLEKQIDAVEHRIAKLVVMEFKIEQRIESGELNESALENATAKLERIDGAQDDLAEKLIDLYAKQAALKERWQDFKDTDKRDRDDADEESDSEDDSADSEDDSDEVDDDSDESDSS